ncbi:NAD-dependent protein deacetylase [Frankia sp. AgKG'84/4]|uniref:NAD-dependent protein deacetylase n=1 Tax=Frankia sp. AgKG'84/4 TaxID=573490 RepID=UPI00201045B8|nr:NAD-dependent protein deacetylase [Frankia sp. AgKG'84/4]MCL9794435.1 NAD-dependent protein deacetylase [Frankia sp. AgKG'84/4]
MDGDASFDELCALVAAGGVAVVTGAGISTDSGIPDYRGPNGELRRHTPMTYQEFTGKPGARHRYWARSHAGWRQIARARPNVSHRAVAQLEGAALLTGVITQNVDGLHQRAGARQVIDLHGNLARVLCPDCGQVSPRRDLDIRLRAANPRFHVTGALANPDGDVTLSEEAVARFVMVDCRDCGGSRLEPDVVFFGATVPRPRVARAFELVDNARMLLILGSSLTVMSGYRFVLRATELGLPVGIVNQGQTRGDSRASLRIDAPLASVLPRLAEAMTGSPAASTDVAGASGRHAPAVSEPAPLRKRPA